MAPVLLLIFLIYLINNCLSCTYYAERHPESPFNEVARYPLGVCSGSHAHRSQESVMYLCSNDNSHIIKYEYTKSSTCNGEYSSSIATRDPNDFICDGDETCPYIVIKIHNQLSTPNDWRGWFSSAWIINHCNNAQTYSCDDNTGYTLNIFENDNCEGTPSQIIMHTTDEYNEYDIYCNQPDPASDIIVIPGFNGIGGNALQPVIETAVCLNGRSSAHHLEIGDNMVSYCFNGYGDNMKPIYTGDLAEIRWTESAGSYGDSYGLFLPDQEWAVAYCFNDSPDISLCTKHWYVDYGFTARYYLDEDMEMNECECSVDMEYQQNENVNDDAVGWYSIYNGLFVGFIILFIRY